ncbi:hypothetical protein PG985_014919 [Apiospora marii]
MTQRLDENTQDPTANARQPSSLRDWLSHYLNDRSLPPPSSSLESPQTPAPKFNDIPAGASLDQIEQILIDDASDLQGYRYYVLKPFRDKLIESWDMYYPWLQVWRGRVRAAAADAQARGLLDNSYELMQRLRLRDPSVSDLNKCKISYETGFGKEYFTFTGIENHPEKKPSDESSIDQEVYDDASEYQVDGDYSSAILSGIRTHRHSQGEDIADLEVGDSSQDFVLDSHVTSSLVEVVDFLSQRGNVEANVYDCINTILGRESPPNLPVLPQPSRGELGMLLEYAAISDLEFDTSTACSRPITLAEALGSKLWVSKTRSGLFCVQCPCPPIPSPLLPSGNSGATHDLLPRHFHIDPLVGDFGLRHFKAKHKYHYRIKSCEKPLADYGRKDNDPTDLTIACHNFAIRLWFSHLVSESGTFLQHPLPDGDDQQDSASLVTKSITASCLSTKGYYQFPLGRDSTQRYVLICTHPDCNWIFNKDPFKMKRAVHHFLRHYGQNLSDGQILRQFVFRVIDDMPNEYGAGSPQNVHGTNPPAVSIEDAGSVQRGRSDESSFAREGTSAQSDMSYCKEVS